MEPDTKPCRKCGATRRYKNGNCAPCGLLRTQRYQAAHPDRLARSNAEYRASHARQIAAGAAERYAANRETMIAASKARRAASAARDPKLAWARRAVSGAKKRAAGAYSVDITPEYVASLAHDTCPALGIPLAYCKNSQMAADSPTLDRIIPDLGYTVGNVAVLSMRANAIKNDGALCEVEAVAAWLRGQYAAIGFTDGQQEAA